VGLVVKPLIEETLQNPIIVSAFLLVTALLLALGEISGKGMRKVANLKGLDALWMGLAQTLALFPGVSRSGSTISAGLLRGLQRGESARFSFLMAFPVMLGAGVLALRDLVNSAPEISQLGPLVIGFLAAALIGYLSIRWLLNYLRTRSFRAFSLYCALVGISGLIYGLLNG
jgi:undecaprenyl-diphosphatase